MLATSPEFQELLRRTQEVEDHALFVCLDPRGKVYAIQRFDVELGMISGATIASVGGTSGRMCYCRQFEFTVLTSSEECTCDHVEALLAPGVADAANSAAAGHGGAVVPLWQHESVSFPLSLRTRRPKRHLYAVNLGCSPGLPSSAASWSIVAVDTTSTGSQVLRCLGPGGNDPRAHSKGTC